jgi:DnaJ-class molecular chaperone
MAKSYFAILGISPDASRDEVKSAYRRLAKEFHPDRCPGGDEKFCQIQEAYAVLRDSRQRREYEARLQETRPAPPPGFGRRQPEPLRSMHGRRQPEALVPNRSFGPFAPGVARIPARPRRSFAARRRRQFGLGTNLSVEVPLTSSQAQRGGIARIVVPVQAVCPACHGDGEWLLLECPRCAGRGTVDAEIPLSVPFPAGLQQEYDVTIPLGPFGAGDVRLTVVFKPSGRL